MSIIHYILKKMLIFLENKKFDYSFADEKMFFG